jgi:DNA-binding NarL/FixJ family response regulator
MKLVLIDDHRLFRDGLRAVLSAHDDMQVVGEASSAREGYAVVDAAGPDVILVDIALPGVDGLTATREILRRHPRGKVLVLSMYAADDYAAQALAYGATGYALKDQPAEQVIEAIRSVAQGIVYLAPRLSRPTVEELAGARTREGADGPLAELSTRERQIFDLVVRGFSNEGIAGELCISVKTVETHRSRINKKLNVHSSADLVRYAVRHGLISRIE